MQVMDRDVVRSGIEQWKKPAVLLKGLAKCQVGEILGFVKNVNVIFLTAQKPGKMHAIMRAMNGRRKWQVIAKTELPELKEDQMFRMRLCVEGDERTYEKIITAQSDEEAIREYMNWLLGRGLNMEKISDRILCDLLTREYLYEHGEMIVNHINHEEYILNGRRFFVGWDSPCKRTDTEGGWIVYKYLMEL